MSWRQEYLRALQRRNAQEHATKEVYDAYTKLADRSARSGATPAIEEGKEVVSKQPKVQSLGQDSTEAIFQIKADLLEAQKARGQLQKRLEEVIEELENLKLKSKDDYKKFSQLTAEKLSLVIKVKDRDDELKGKTKLLDDVHDETLALTLQLNVETENNKKLAKENKDLVDRWMARMAKEAEDMNHAYKFS